jgi:hypothetical protein
MAKKINTCEQHNICESSDSNLAICKCWCAECKEIMADNIEALNFASFSKLMSIYGATVEKGN